jgi:Tfp pilus assembly protein PilF
VAREPGEKAELLFQLAQTSLLRKDLPGAAAFLDRCLALDPSYPQAREVRASLP